MPHNVELLYAVNAELIIKKSRFIANVLPVYHKTEVTEYLFQQKLKFPDARHICSVFLLPQDSGLDDDGEPKGTAAKPILNVLQHKQLTNVLAVVIRYFGGIKLGAGGLARAYSQSVSLALQTAEYVPIIPSKTVTACLPFALESQLRHLCQKIDINIESISYQDQLHIQLKLPNENCEEKLALLSAQLQGLITFY